MPNFTVRRRGTDSSGRPIYATDYMWSWWLGVCGELGFSPVITQGAFMSRAGGGASASAGYHDLGACFDLRVWNLTDAQVAKTIATLRANGAAAWLRNVQHGGFTDPHIHLVLGTDSPLDDGAAYQWRSYQVGGDGMGGKDYHPRPKPLVTTPPERDWFDMATEADLRKIVREEIQAREDEIAAKAAKAVLAAPVIAKLDVNVRQALRDAVDEGRKQNKG